MLDLEHPLRRFRLPALLVAGAMAYGTIGYVVLERWDVFDAFYMTITTIATVGYGEIRPLTAVGRVFTATLIVGGVGTMLYAFGVFAEVLAEGRFAAFRRQRRMTREIAQLRGHYIICGYGRVGTQIAQEFDRQRIPHVIVELNEEPLARARHEGRALVEGDAASEDVLRAAGIERAKGLLAVTDSDERVVYITLAARALVPGLFIVARAGRPESVRRLELAGASRVVSPYRMAGRLMAQLALRPAVADVIETMQHGGGRIGIEEILVGGSSPARGRSLGEARLLEPGRARLLALRRSDGSLHVDPGAELLLEDGDLLVAMGTDEELQRTVTLIQ